MARRAALGMLVKLILILLIILAVSSLALKAARHAQGLLGDAEAFLPTLQEQESVYAPRILTYTPEPERLTFHPAFLPKGVWLVTLQEDDRVVKRVQVSNTRQEIPFPIHPRGALHVYTLTLQPVKSEKKITYAYVLVHPDRLEGASLSMLARLIHEHGLRVTKPLLEACRLGSFPLEDLSSVLAFLYCDVPGDAVETPGCAAERECRACLAAHEEGDAFILASLLYGVGKDGLPPGLDACFTQSSWRAFVSALTRGPFQPPLRECSSPTFSQIRNPLVEYACYTHTLSLHDWAREVNRAVGGAVLSNTYQCEPLRAEGPSIGNTVWRPRLLSIPLTCTPTPRFTFIQTTREDTVKTD